MDEEASSKTGGLSPEYKTYERQKCFVAHSHGARWCDDVVNVCNQVLPEFGLEPWYAADHFDPIKPLRDKVVELIANTRYGIYDLSYWRKDDKSEWHMPRNVLIELGVAIALNRPTLLLRHAENRISGLQLPTCLESISAYILEFSGGVTLQRILREHLSRWVQHTPPEHDWWNRYCMFGNRICEHREAYPHGRQWGQETIRCHISDGQDTDRLDFRGVVEEVLGRFSDVTFGYLDALPMADGYDFLLCTHCQAVRSTPFAIYRITPQTPAETFLAIGMSLALEAQFTHRIPKILLTTNKHDIPSLLSGYEVVESRNDQECKTYLRKFMPDVIREVRKTTWRPRPLPFIQVVPKHVEKPAAGRTHNEAVAAARQLLQRFKAEHPEWENDKTPIDELVSWHGLEIATFHQDDRPEGTYGWLEPKEDLIWLCRSLPETLRRFTLAHELGHAVLHRYASQQAQHVPQLSGDDPCQMVDVQEAVTGLIDQEQNEEILGTGQSYNPRSQRELAANIFATELLMPLERVQSLYLGQQTPSASLAGIFGVSGPAMLNRLAGLLVASPGKLGSDAQSEVMEASISPEQGEDSYINEIGKYGLIREIGRGSFATVYLALNMESNQIYAMKVMHPELSQDSELLARFQRESSILMSLDDPHIVRGIDYGNDNNIHFIVMDYIDGQNLKYHMLTGGPMEPLRALNYARQVAEGLDAAYKQGVVHRNIKPQDILITSQDVVKITDFGLARSRETVTLTQSNVFMGTAYYISPEQAESGRSADTRSDLYSVATVLFEMLAGHPPFEGDTAVDIVIKHMHEKVPSISHLRPDLPVDMDAFFEKAMAKSPADRFQTPREFIAALDQLQRRIQVVPSSEQAADPGSQQGAASSDELNMLVGKTLGQFRIVERIGVGSVGIVFKAYQPTLDRYVAIKVLPAYHARDPNFVKRFVQEARSVARLAHPNIVQIHDFGEQDSLTYIVMDYIDGGTLKDRLKGRALPVAETVGLIMQAAEGLDYAHRMNIVHRNLKPTNMLLRKDGHLFLSGFGIARILEGTTNLTRVGTAIGTPQYMSPEQGAGRRVVPSSDIYSLGIVLFQCLTGRVPFNAESPISITVKHLNEPLPVELLRMAGIPGPLEEVVVKMTAKSPQDRYQLAGDVIDGLLAASSLSPLRQYSRSSTTLPLVAPSGPSEMPERTCFRCGTVNLGTRMYCTTCGYDLLDKQARADSHLGSDGRPVIARISFQSGLMAGRSFLFHQVETTIGRTNNNDLIIPGRIVSRRHAHLWFDNGNWYLEDLQSANGTTVNSVRIHEPVQLNDGDVITFGDEVAVFNTAYRE